LDKTNSTPEKNAINVDDLKAHNALNAPVAGLAAYPLDFLKHPLFTVVCLLLLLVGFVSISIYLTTTTQRHLMEVQAKINGYGAELHAMHDQVTSDAIRRDLTAAMAGVDNLKAVNAKHLWAALKGSDRVFHLLDSSMTEGEQFDVAIDALTHSDGNSYSDIVGKYKAAVAAAADEDYMLQHYLENMNQLVTISSSLDGIAVQLATIEKSEKNIHQ
jgi:hypothetical protein